MSRPRTGQLHRKTIPLRRIHSLTHRAFAGQLFLARFCLEAHVLAGLWRYVEAVDMIRSLIRDCEPCEGKGHDTSTEEGSEDCSPSNDVSDDIGDYDWDDFFVAAPAEIERPSAMKGTRGTISDSRIHFEDSVHAEGPMGIVMGDLPADHFDAVKPNADIQAVKSSFIRAIARARRMYSQVNIDQPVSKCRPLREVCRTVFIRDGDDALIVDRRCDWSVDGFTGYTSQSWDAIPRCTLRELASRKDVADAIFYDDCLNKVNSL